MSGTFVNLCKAAPALPSPIYGLYPYNPNFTYPILPQILENSKIQLTPFVPALHAQTYWAQASPLSHPELYDYLPWNFTSLDDFLAILEKIRQDPMWILFAILDKTKNGSPLAEIIGVIHCEPHNQVAEIGATLRSHVASNAIGLIMRYCLDLPKASPPGLGLRRVIWTTSPENVASMKAVEKMGMKRPDDSGPSVEIVQYAICWDDWEDGGREIVTKVMDRR
ncbi:hypothetical protein NEOLEDRAFT_1165147 [Neolentinus lepideus HHB14362 ss-1]|uniref:N-acetyltransferase domain-containing protein n=1 Tax=Neolentinus lepideus HHB14362 ss-1 TaxID=1314782 RepID=A0A165NV07_9AGAM|nr:hypothetical protein NEOLEDRAFT_1165147 [Neolentinus lepideus HHB14362 ss-1]